MLMKEHELHQIEHAHLLDSLLTAIYAQFLIRKYPVENVMTWQRWDVVLQMPPFSNPMTLMRLSA